jgi:hypothetical protein
MQPGDAAGQIDPPWIAAKGGANQDGGFTHRSNDEVEMVRRWIEEVQIVILTQSPSL